MKKFFIIFLLIINQPLGFSIENVYVENKNNDNNDVCDSDDCKRVLIKANYIEKTNSIIIAENNKDVIEQYLPDSLKSLKGLDNCAGKEDALCMSWDKSIKIRVRRKPIKKKFCSEINFSSENNNVLPKVCLPLNSAHWFGGSELHYQRWPIEIVDIPMQPYVSNDAAPAGSLFGNVLEPYWINSNGLGIFVDDLTPLHVSINEKGSRFLCFQANFQTPHFQESPSTYRMLNYTVCKQKNVKEIRNLLHDVLFDLPDGIPDRRMLKSPIWSTWARYKTLINQTTVLHFAEEIKHHGFSNSQLEIDDMFSTKYGDFDFDPDKFPDPLEMVQTLKSHGFRTTIWITPFANVDSIAFLEGTQKAYWLKDKSGTVPALVKWWQGIGTILDTTNQDAVEWFVERLREMRMEYQLDSFKFDAGELNYLPSSYSTMFRLGNPGYFTTLYVDMVSRLGDMIEVRCGFKSQKHAIFVRMADKESRWGYNNGIKTLIPTVLSLGILGYPYVLPDMIGGNGYGENFGFDTKLPDKELYIRWLQISAYLPAMQFSFVPWDYDEEVITLAKEMVDVHENIVFPILLDAALETQETGMNLGVDCLTSADLRITLAFAGAPLIRPLWWIAPNDEKALTNDDEFLVGDKLLVAPILEKGARSRDIYLPKGQWKDGINGNTISGPTTLSKYAVSLTQIATFMLIN